MGWCLRSDQIVIHLRLSALLIYNSCANSIYIRTQNLGAAYRNLEPGFLPLLELNSRAKLRRVVCRFLYYGAPIPSWKVIKRNENHSAKAANWMETLLQWFAGYLPRQKIISKTTKKCNWKQQKSIEIDAWNHHKKHFVTALILLWNNKFDKKHQMAAKSKEWLCGCFDGSYHNCCFGYFVVFYLFVWCFVNFDAFMLFF